MTTGTMAQYAAHIGASPPYVTKLKQQGRLVLVRQDDDTELVDFELSDRLVRSTTDMGRAGNGANSNPPGGSAATRADPLAGGGGVDDLFRRAQAQERVYTAKLAELQYRKVAGELIDRERAVQATFTAFRQLRDGAMVIGRKLAPALASVSDEAAIRVAIERALREVFDSFHKRTLASLNERLAGRPVAEPDVQPAPESTGVDA